MSRSGIPRHAPLTRYGWVATSLLLATLLLDSPTPASAQEEEPARSPAPAPALSSESGEADALLLHLPAFVAVNEEQELRVTARVEGARGPVRLFVEGLPPGAVWDEPSRTLSFRPDFIQGGVRHELSFTATDGHDTVRAEMTLAVHDTVRPPAPRIVRVEPLPGCVRLTLEQTTDAWLDSRGYAGRKFAAVVTVPLAASALYPMPVKVRLHGVGAWPPEAQVSTDRFLIEPSDPDLTYWWGYSERLPAAPAMGGRVQPYTARRVLALLEWVLRHYPGADPERVLLEGDSMGGAGALSLGLLSARHFAGVSSTHGQPVPRAHRPRRLAQLSTLWGHPEREVPDADGLGVWRRLDLTRALRDEPEARSQFLFLGHGKDDPIIHFGAVVGRSPLTGASFYGTLQAERLGHLAVWDEGGHQANDPWLGADWWNPHWDFLTDAHSFLRRDTAFPAFTRSSWDDHPGDGGGNGRQPWREDSGFAGDSQVPGDTGWNGDAAGMLNRSLRWDASRLVDTHERFELPLRVERGPGTSDFPLVDVTPRRVQRFHALPGERIRWSFGERSGTLTAADDGSVTVTDLQLGDEWRVLVLERTGS